MIINENRGSYGMFSRAGRSSTEKFHILIKKDEILKGTKTKKERSQEVSDESDIDIYENEEEEFSSKLKINPKKNKTKKKEPKKVNKQNDEKFQEIIAKNKRLSITPAFNKYNPKKDFVWKKIVNDYDFDKSQKKNFTIKPKEEIRAKYYIQHDVEGKNIQGKNQIELSKQTARKSFIGLKTENEEDLYANNYNTNYATNYPSNNNNGGNLNNMNFNSSRKNFFSNDKIKSYSSGFYNNNTNNTNNKGKTQTNFNSPVKSLKSDLDEKENYMRNSHSNFAFNNNFGDTKRETGMSFRSNAFKTSYSSFPNYAGLKDKDDKKWIKIQAPDFKRMGSREILVKENPNKEKKRIIPVRFPSFTAIKQSNYFCFKFFKIFEFFFYVFFILFYFLESKNFVNYNNEKTVSKKYERPDTVPVNSQDFDPYKTLSKINAHKEIRGPNFDLMTSRPKGKNALPCFVQVSLKLNTCSINE